MSVTPRLRICLIALCFSFNSLLPVAWASAAQGSTDESELRSLAETYFKTWAAKDLDGFLRLWSGQSPELEARRKAMEKLFATSDRIELRGLTIRSVKVDKSQARLRVEAELHVIEAGTGKEMGGYGKMPRTLECIKEAGHWKISREDSTYDEIAAALAAAGSGEQRMALLSEEKEFVTAGLLRALGNQGNRFIIQADYSQALAIHGLALNIAEKLNDQLGIAIAQHQHGLIYHFQGNYAQALDHFQKTLVIVKALGDNAQISGNLNNIGLVHHSLGNYARALEYFQKGLAMSEARNDNQGIAVKLNNIGRVYRVQGNYAQALRYYQKSLALSESLGNNYGIALTLLNIGNIYRIQGDFPQAMESYQKSLVMREAIADKSGIAGTLNNIGRVHYAQGSYAQALEYFQKSLAMRESIGDKAGIADTLNILAEVYEKQGHYGQAMETASRAAMVARQIGDTEILWKAHRTEGAAHRALKEYTKARLAFEESVAVIETLRANVVGGGDEQQRFFESKVASYHALVDLLTREGRASEALSFAERAKARVLLDMLQAGRVNMTKSLTGKEQEQEQKLRAELISLNTQVTRAGRQDKPDQARIDELISLREKARLNYEAFQTSLYAAHPELRVHRGEAPVIRAEEVAALLPDTQSALLEYVVTDNLTYLFVCAKATEKSVASVKVFALPIKRDELIKQTENFRQQLAGRDLGFRASARRLYQLLLKPAEAQLRGKTNLVIVPDDKLWELPFQALLTEGDRFLLERSAVSYAPSLTVLREMKTQHNKRQEQPPASALLALGNPAIGRETIERASLTLRDGKLDPLPEAEEEVKALGRLYGAGRSKIYVGAEAREDRAKTEATQAGVLHFATHGILNDASPMYSYLVLAQGDKNEDGLLEAWELMQLDLKADLAVLSACETARGRFGAGEGMIGLTWAMFIAGVPTTVVSQWKVESAGTRELMLGFHRQLRSPSKAKATKAEALRQAALKVLKTPETSHPFYWAGFVLVGVGR